MTTLGGQFSTIFIPSKEGFRRWWFDVVWGPGWRALTTSVPMAIEGQAAEPPKKKAKKAKDLPKDDRQIHFRNYIPRTPDLRDFCLPRITSADIEAEIDKEIQEAIAAAEDTDAVLAIAPRKPNWDLKRDVERKMHTLAARTDRAVVQLIRQRIKKDEGGEANLEDKK